MLTKLLKRVGFAVSCLLLANCGAIEPQQTDLVANADNRILIDEALQHPLVKSSAARLSPFAATVDIKAAYIVRANGAVAVILPVQQQTSGPLPFSEIVYERSGNGATAVHVSGDGLEGTTQESDTGAQPTEQSDLQIPGSRDDGDASIDCGSWGGWYTIGSHCGSTVVCPLDGFNAVMLDRKRDRRCCSGGRCYTISEVTTVRNKCGC